jgi:hypothetical protein
MRWRSASLTACSAILLASCAGGSDDTATPTTTERRPVAGPRIEGAVADRLARRSEGVAARLDDGDSRGATAEAAKLRSDLTAAINDQAIPSRYLEDLSGSVNELQAQVEAGTTIEPPPPTAQSVPRGATAAESARLLAQWLRERAG